MDDETVETGKESGGSLREKLEAALARESDLKAKVLSYQAREVIAEKGYKHVTPEDLKGVDLDGIEAKAEELEQAKAAQEAEVLKRVLGSKLGDGADVDAVIQGLLGGGDDQSAALDRIRSVGKVQGSPVAKDQDAAGLSGPELLRHAFRTSK